jgi:hypothetical protein
MDIASGPFLQQELARIRCVCVVQEDYSDFKTLESRLQDVARRLVHRPGGQAPSSSQGTHGLLPNGVFDPSSGQQPQPAAQQFGVQAGTANPQMTLSAYPGAQGMQPGSGMMPTPSTAAGDATDLISVKPEPGSTTNGMVPLEGAADPSSSFQRSSMPGMVPVSGVMGSSSAMGASLMSNGAPIIKQDAWSMPSPSMVPVRAAVGTSVGSDSFSSCRGSHAAQHAALIAWCCMDSVLFHCVSLLAEVAHSP